MNTGVDEKEREGEVEINKKTNASQEPDKIRVKVDLSSIALIIE